MYENSVFIFLSDNGATQESGYIKQLMADLSNTPFRNYKCWTYHGGISTPMIISYGTPQKNIKNGSITPQVGHIIDVFPTSLDIAKVSYPSNFKGNKIALQGISLFPAMQQKKITKRDIFFEHQTSCAIVSDGWKLVRLSAKTLWELIDLNKDPFEQNDVAQKYPKKVQQLEKQWTQWATQQNVFPFEFRSWGERINYYKKLYPKLNGEK